MINFIMRTIGGTAVLVVLLAPIYGLYCMYLSGNLLLAIAFVTFVGFAYTIGKALEGRI